MVTFTTSTCAARGHPEFTIQFAKPLVPRGERLLLTYFEDAVARGERFEAGHTIGLGGHQLRVTSRSDGTLGVEEPVPAPHEQWVEALDRTVREVTAQRWVCESVELPVTFPPPNGDCFVAACVKSTQTLALTRVATPTEFPQLSGWTLSCTERHDHDERSTLPILALSALWPFVVQFLALPTDSVVLVAPPGRGHVFFRGAQVTPLPGSYLQQLNDRR
jgi:hypothetical protein